MKPLSQLFASVACAVLMIGCAASSKSPEPALQKSPAPQLGWRLGCQAWTFRAMTLYETLDQLKALDLHYIEMFPGQKLSPEKPNLKADHNMAAEDIAALKRKLNEAGVKAVSYGVVHFKDETEARKIFDFARAMGMEQVVAEPNEDQFDMLDRMTAEYGIRLAIHDHPKPSHYWNPDTVLKVTTGRSDRIGACADIGHWLRSGLVPVDCLKKLQGKIIELHFKDINAAHEDVPWGTGQVDIKACMTELKRQNFHGLLAIEYERTTGQELVDNVRKSIEYFNQVAAELAK
jgi:sugar phosphate isomerase/epimerase